MMFWRVKLDELQFFNPLKEKEKSTGVLRSFKRITNPELLPLIAIVFRALPQFVLIYYFNSFVFILPLADCVSCCLCLLTSAATCEYL